MDTRIKSQRIRVAVAVCAAALAAGTAFGKVVSQKEAIFPLSRVRLTGGPLKWQ